ncbi:MAG: ATP-binding cassette domain-containing protein, partial [Nitrososphaerales archaeon]
IIKLQIPFKVPKKEFKIDKSFKTKSELTERTIAIAEAFGIGIDDEHEFTIFKEFIVNINPGDIVYITGDSGGGKSILLNMLCEELKNIEEFKGVIRNDEISINPDEVIIEGIGKDVNDAINKLSMAGLNDAFLFLRRYKELSDGQKYRYRIAKMLDSDKGVWACDEFVATLDREAAKIVAFCLQKTARRAKKTAIIATTHNDLFDDLKPSVFIEKGFGYDVKVNYYPNKINKECSIAKNVKIREGSFKDWLKLERFHYRAKHPYGIRKIFAMEINDKVIGVIVYSSAPLYVAGRKKFLGYNPKPDEVNKDFLIISRVVLHPKYRSIGLGAKLVRETLPLAGVKYVEAIAVMAKYNPFFLKADMIPVKVESSLAKKCQDMLYELEQFGFKYQFMSSETYNLCIINRLSLQQYKTLINYLTIRLKKLYLLFGSAYHHRKVAVERVHQDLENRYFCAKIIKDASIKAQAKNYYIWSNQKFK